MHLIATFCLVLTDSALRTSEKVPSPSFLTKRYSTDTSEMKTQAHRILQRDLLCIKCCWLCVN